MTPRLNCWLLLILIIVGIPYYWLLVDPSAGPWGVVPKITPITVESLRELAKAEKGNLPNALHFENIGSKKVSGNLLVAGSGLHRSTSVVRSYALTFSDRQPILIDRGTSQNIAQSQNFQIFDRAAQARVNRLAGSADQVILLANTPAHNGGLIEAPVMKAQALLRPHPVAPGIVAIPTPELGHGAQMVYAKLESGHEYLFTGDAALLSTSWLNIAAPARFSMRNKSYQYRQNSLAWLTVINALHRAAPNMIIVSGHEPTNIPFSAVGFSD